MYLRDQSERGIVLRLDDHLPPQFCTKAPRADYRKIRFFKAQMMKCIDQVYLKISADNTYAAFLLMSHALHMLQTGTRD